MGKIKELLARNIEENIAPVVYFHKQDPADLEREVREYVITTRPGSGGETGGGIHEQYVSLLQAIARALHDKETSLPAAWISGFYGSGKSSFAKLLGLALDGKTLPNGQSLAEALLERDETPQATEFRQAWQDLRAQVDPMAVVFDIGALARSHEMIHKTIFRAVRQRLGYSENDSIAYYEQLLEEEQKYTAFLELCAQKFGPWDTLKNKKIAPQTFSKLYSELEPELYPDPLDWFDHHDLHNSQDANSVKEAIEGLEKILERRAAGKTLFIVIDEMYQHIGLDQARMLDMQTFVSELGARLEGRVWLLVTGQERLVDAGETSMISKMRDRFPPRFRVHLDRANVTEIVHQRLLKKRPERLAELEACLNTGGALSLLKLHGYDCGQLTPEDLYSHYPLLPGHISLLLDISQGIHNHSSRKQGDSASVRGVLQIIWDLFNHRQIGFKERPIGDLITFDLVYDILRSSLNSDTLLTMDKIAEKSEDNPLKYKVAKAIALLEMIQGQVPTTDSLIASVLYPHLGADSLLSRVKTALEELAQAHLIVQQEQMGWRIQDHAGQDWQRQRDEISIGPELIVETVYKKLGEVMAGVDKYRFYNTPLNWLLWKDAHEKLSSRTDAPAVQVDFRFELPQKKRRTMDEWLSLSKESVYQQRFLWVSGDANEAYHHVRKMLRSQKMVEKYERQRLDANRQRLLLEEKAQKEKLESELPKILRQCWLNGEFYFNGSLKKSRDLGPSFEAALHALLAENLETIYPHFKEGNLQISKDQLAELFKPDLAAPNPQFLDRPGGLGILKLDAGKIVFQPLGPIPIKIKEYLEKQHSVTGPGLISTFSEAPFGYPKTVLKACLIGLLRAKLISIRDGGGSELSSIQDPGIKEALLEERNFNRIEILFSHHSEISPKERVRFANFFETQFGKELPREDDPLADAVFQTFDPLQNEVQSQIQTLLQLQLPVPPALTQLNEVLSKTRRDRRVNQTLQALSQYLEPIETGLKTLRSLQNSLNESAIAQLTEARQILNTLAQQMADFDAADRIHAEWQLLQAQLESETPWAFGEAHLTALETIQTQYFATRSSLLLQLQSEQAEMVQNFVQHPGWEKLSPDHQEKVLMVLKKAFWPTEETTTTPSLLKLRQSFDQRASEVLSEAQALLEEMSKTLEREVTPPSYFEEIPLRNFAQEIENERELQRVCDQLYETCLAKIDQGKRVRLV